MAKFAQYYLKYKLDDLFAQETKADRQKFFGALFEKDESIEFAVGEGEDRKVFKPKVYHLSLNKDIIVMRIANDTTKEVEQDFKKIDVKHEPSCFVVIDNRERCRRIAVQKQEGALTPKRVCEILTKVVGDKMLAEHYIGIELFPQFYPKDFYKAWRMHQHHTIEHLMNPLRDTNDQYGHAFDDVVNRLKDKLGIKTTTLLNQTLNYNAPIGQQIAYADKVERSHDGEQ